MAEKQKDNILDLLRVIDDKIEEVSRHVVANIKEKADFQDEILEAPYVFSDIDDRPSKLRGKKGVYVFEITQDVPLSREQVRRWSELCKGAGFNDWFQGDLKMGDILYVGSCISESLFTRVRQHFLDESPAASLRLGNPARRMVYNAVRVYAYPIKKEYKTYNRYIIPQIEKKLHEALNPKAGSSRV